MSTQALGQLIRPAPVERAGERVFPILSMTMHQGLVDQGNKFKKRVASKDLSEYRVVRRSQLVVGFPIDEGVLAFQDLYERAVVSPAYGIWDVRPEGPDVDHRYLQRFLRSPRALNFYLAKLRSTTARRRSLPREVFLSLEVPLPSLGEQRRIADVLDRAEELRAKRSRAIEQLEVLKQSMFLDMFGDPNLNPHDWLRRRLADVCSIAGEYGANVPSAQREERLPRYIRITDVRDDGSLIPDAVSPGGAVSDWESYRLEVGDVLFARSGATVGKTYLHSEPFDAVFAGYLIRFRPDPSTVLPEVLFTFTKTAAYKAWVKSKMRTVAQPNINASLYGSELIIPVPPLELQREFVRRLSAMRLLEESQLRGADGLAGVFTSLQRRAFSGAL